MNHVRALFLCKNKLKKFIKPLTNKSKWCIIKNVKRATTKKKAEGTTMKKYNLSKIMKDAWNLFRTFKTMVKQYQLSFGECLKRAWEDAKRAARVFTGLVEDVQIAGTLMHPVCVDIDMDALTVTGNTYPARKQLAELGLRWNKELKAWCGSRETLNAICVKYVA